MHRRTIKLKTYLIAGGCILLVGMSLFWFARNNWQAQGTPLTSQGTNTPDTPTPAPTGTSSVLNLMPQQSTPTATTKTPSTPTPTPVQAAQGQRVVTFVNHMQQTVWVAAASSAGHDLAKVGEGRVASHVTALRDAAAADDADSELRH